MVMYFDSITDHVFEYRLKSSKKVLIDLLIKQNFFFHVVGHVSFF